MPRCPGPTGTEYWALLPSLLDLLTTYGPGLLFLMAVAETSFVTGLVVPAGAATSVATVLAAEGLMGTGTVAAAAISGGFVGDTAGFWIGRKWGDAMVPRHGVVGRRVQHAYRVSEHFFGRHPFYSVTVARLVAFVRTMMPLGAGMSDLSYSRFLVFESVGVVLWAAMYMTVGLLAGESLQLATSVLGVGWTVVFVVVGLGIWATRRRRRS